MIALFPLPAHHTFVVL